MAKNQAKSLNSKNLSLLKKVGDKTQFTMSKYVHFKKCPLLLIINSIMHVCTYTEDCAYK